MFGSFLNGPKQASNQNQQAWTGFLQDPKASAFLANVGLQLMMPSWQGGLSQVGQALGAGFQGAAGVERIQQAEQARADAQAHSAASKAETRAQTVSDNTTKHQNDMELERLKQSGRQDLLSQKQSVSGHSMTKADMDVYAKSMNNLRRLNEQKLDPNERLSEDDMRALAQGDVLEARRLSGRGDSDKITSQNMASGSAPVGQAGPAETPKITSQKSQTPFFPRGAAVGRSAPAQTLRPIPPEVQNDPALSDPVYRAFMRSKGFNVPE